VAKQLQMHYRAPPLPVDLRTFGGGDDGAINDMINVKSKPNLQRSESPMIGTVLTEVDREAQMKEFHMMALSKHNIRLN
jgi:hypothetical protein